MLFFSPSALNQNYTRLPIQPRLLSHKSREMQRKKSDKTRIHHIRDRSNRQKTRPAPPERTNQHGHRNKSANRRETTNDEIHDVKHRGSRNVPLLLDSEI